MTEQSQTTFAPGIKYARPLPGSPQWHAWLADFWRREITKREDQLQEARGELQAARKAHREHAAKAAL